MTPIDFPSGIAQTDVTLSLRGAVGVAQSPYTFTRHVQDWGGERWELTINFLSQRMQDIGPLEAFLLKVRHGRQTFRCGDPYASLPQGTATGSATVSGTATAGSSTLATSGWSGTLLAGDLVQIGDHLYKLLADASGGGTLELAPRLRLAYASGTSIIYNNPRGVFAVDGNVTTTERFIASRRAQPAPLTAIEAL